MKLRNLLLGLLLCTTAVSAQDVITKTDGSKIDAKVEEITEQSVRYRKATNPTGPVYSIPLTSILTITYENGSVDNFNTPAAPATQTPAYPSAVSNHYTRYQNSATSSAMNDAQLLRMSYQNNDPYQLRKKAQTYRIVGWTGGVVLLTAVIGISFGTNKYFIEQDCSPIVLAAGAVAGAAWCLGFNLKARSLMRKANEIEMLSSNIIEDKIFSIGDKPMIAGINVMSNQMTHTRGLGVSLKLNF